MPGEAIRGILIPFFGTMSGSACVLFMRKRMDRMLQRVLTGFVFQALLPEVIAT